MKVKTYTYEVNNFICGQIQAKNKKAVKDHARHLAEIFCPSKGIKTIKIAEVKE